ncbi:MAG: DUF962 domain-containing protein [Pseudomonadota bacterium]
MSTETRYQTYEDFFPFYLTEHSKETTRWFHYIGTSFALICFALFLTSLDYIYLLAGLVGAYGLAWISHFFVEHNKPATFKYPFWSYLADHHMLWLALTGRIKPAMDDAHRRISAKS